MNNKKKYLKDLEGYPNDNDGIVCKFIDPITEYECEIRRHEFNGTYMAYVKIPETHKLFNSHYNDINHLFNIHV